MDVLPNRNLLMRIIDLLAEWQMRQSLRAICRGQKPRAGLASCGGSPGV